ncbi:MAG TPA: phage tail protein, partial [Sphingomicrobium sp.]|nr:phage tail protein [Sphingomicrobium sp.]
GSIAEAVQPLVDCFDVALFDDGEILRSPGGGDPMILESDEVGSSSDGRAAPRIQREQQPSRDVPSTLRLTYYDPDRDYQAGEARAVAGEQSTNEVRQELPAVLTAGDAKSLVQQMLARQWSARDRLTLRLPPGRIAIEPGSIVEPGVTPPKWRVEQSTIDGFVAIVELRPSWQPQPQLIGEPGRIVTNPDVPEAPLSLALIDIPNVAGSPLDGPIVLVAASSPNPGWRARPLTINLPGQSFTTQTAISKSVLGRMTSALGNAEPYLIDRANSVEVQLIDPDQWLTSCDDGALADGVNLAVIGKELVQFGEVMALGSGRFRLAHLLRGRGGTEWAAPLHEADELFCLLDNASVRAVSVPTWARGSTVSVVDRDGSTASLEFAGECVRPLSPVDVSASLDQSGNLSLRWTRRSRSGFAWVDEVDAPIGEEREQYSLTVTGASSDLELVSAPPNAVIAAADLVPLGPGPAVIGVRQIGDWAASRLTQLSIDLP